MGAAGSVQTYTDLPRESKGSLTGGTTENTAEKVKVTTGGGVVQDILFDFVGGFTDKANGTNVGSLISAGHESAYNAGETTYQVGKNAGDFVSGDYFWPVVIGTGGLVLVLLVKR